MNEVDSLNSEMQDGKTKVRYPTKNCKNPKKDVFDPDH